MSGRIEFDRAVPASSREHILYIKQMLAELAQVARNEKADLLAYLLEMAFTEATDLLNGRSDSIKVERHHPARMAVKPAGKI